MKLEDLLKEIRELDAKATKGPWGCLADYTRYDYDSGFTEDEADHNFITRARTLLPVLGRIVELLLTEIMDLPSQADDCRIRLALQKILEDV